MYFFAIVNKNLKIYQIHHCWLLIPLKINIASVFLHVIGKQILGFRIFDPTKDIIYTFQIKQTNKKMHALKTNLVENIFWYSHKKEMFFLLCNKKELYHKKERKIFLESPTILLIPMEKIFRSNLWKVLNMSLESLSFCYCDKYTTTVDSL